MTEHVLHTPENCDREPYDPCVMCDGGLSYCEVCHGAESCLPTECPGRQMMAHAMDAVTAGTLDFKNGKWVKK